MRPTTDHTSDSVTRPHRRAVLVVDADVDRRRELREGYEARGFEVATCSGADGINCPALIPGAESCSRVHPDLHLIVIDEASAAGPRPACYTNWAPGAGLAVAGPDGITEIRAPLAPTTENPT